MADLEKCTLVLIVALAFTLVIVTSLNVEGRCFK